MKSLLVTGGAGFIGANFINYFLGTYDSYKIINLDKLTYASNISFINQELNHGNYVFIEGDICDTNLVDSLFKTYSPIGIIHFAAESHVDNSILGPRDFIKTNIEGTFNLIDIAKKHWGNNSEHRFHHVSTDEVYGPIESGLMNEFSKYSPSSP